MASFSRASKSWSCLSCGQASSFLPSSSFSFFSMALRASWASSFLVLSCCLVASSTSLRSGRSEGRTKTLSAVTGPSAAGADGASRHKPASGAANLMRHLPRRTLDILFLGEAEGDVKTDPRWPSSHEPRPWPSRAHARGWAEATWLSVTGGRAGEPTLRRARLLFPEELPRVVAHEPREENAADEDTHHAEHAPRHHRRPHAEQRRYRSR